MRRTCDNCDEQFTPEKPFQRHCNERCRQDAKRRADTMSQAGWQMQDMGKCPRCSAPNVWLWLTISTGQVACGACTCQRELRRLGDKQVDERLAALGTDLAALVDAAGEIAQEPDDDEADGDTDDNAQGDAA